MGRGRRRREGEGEEERERERETGRGSDNPRVLSPVTHRRGSSDLLDTKVSEGDPKVSIGVGSETNILVLYICHME